MIRYLLDTNIISNVVKESPSPSLLAWMAEREDGELYISAFTLAELQRGILEKATGRKREALQKWFDGPEGPSALFAGRTLAFDDRAALVWASLMAEGKRAGRPRNGFDMIIAAVATANACTLVTDHERDFQGLDMINPVRGAPARD